MAKRPLKIAKASLENILELLGPYLPKTDLEEPDPGRDWSIRTSDNGNDKENQPSTAPMGNR